MNAYVGSRPFAGRGGHRTRMRADLFLSVAILVAFVAVLAMIATHVGGERSAIQALPADQRRAVYSRTLDDLRELCGDNRPDALKDHCRSLADFIVQFDECSGECEAIARHQLVQRPTR